MGEHRRKITAYIKASVVVLCAAMITALSTAREVRGADQALTFLVATRDMPDPMFQHTVILMVPSPEELLVAGVIINKPTEMPVKIPESGKGKSQTAFFGGPVEPDTASLIVRAARAPEKSTLLFDDIYLSTDANTISRLLKNPGANDMRLILGRAQWLKEQLHTEIVAGAWYVEPAKSGLVFSDPKSLWNQLVTRGELMEVDAPRSRPASGWDPIGGILAKIAGVLVRGVDQRFEARGIATPGSSFSSAIVKDMAVTIENRDGGDVAAIIAGD